MRHPERDLSLNHPDPAEGAAAGLVPPLLARRARAQLLSGPQMRHPLEVVERLLAVQAQDPRGFRLAVRVRSAGLTAADVDAALNDRSLVVTWLNRGTLHLVRADDYWWLHAMTTPSLRTENGRRLAQTGVSPAQAEHGVGVIVHALAANGPLTREDLRQQLDSAGVPTAGQALVHVLLRASIDGLIVRGPVVDGHHRYALVADWLGPRPPVDGDAALAELARRYLAGHGPATDRDLAAWAGLGLGLARQAIRTAGAELVSVSGLACESGSPGGPGSPGGSETARGLGAGDLVDLGHRRLPPRLPMPAPRLLGPFDPLLHGWPDRRAILGDNPTVVTTNGIFRPVLLADGRAVATWGLREGVVRLNPFAPLSATLGAAARREAVAVGRYLGLGPLSVEVTENDR